MDEILEETDRIVVKTEPLKDESERERGGQTVKKGE